MINTEANFTDIKDYMYFTAEMLPRKFSSAGLEGTRLCHTKARMFLKLSPRTQSFIPLEMRGSG